MNINSVSTSLKALFSQSYINALARQSGFVNLLRGLEPVKLIAALCNVLVTREKANLADIQRELCAVSVSARSTNSFMQADH